MEKVLEQVVTNLKLQVRDELATITHDHLPTVMADREKDGVLIAEPDPRRDQVP